MTMPASWCLTVEPRGLILNVEATINRTDAERWAGQITSLPIAHLAVLGVSHAEAREKLARQVLAEVTTGMLPVPAGSVDAVRVLSTSLTTHPRGTAADGPVIIVPATAERHGETWRAQTFLSAGVLAGRKAKGLTMADARDGLATILMLEMELGVAGIPESWSGIQMLTTTLKTYPVGMLTDA